MQRPNWGVEYLRIPETWKTTRGEGVTVLVIDTGCPAAVIRGKTTLHPDLAGNVEVDRCRSFVYDEDGIFDESGHSTACCGVIAAEDNRQGVVGYAPAAKIVTYKAVPKSGAGKPSDLVKALEAAIDLRPDVVSVSIGLSAGASKMRKSIRALADMGIPVVCSAGNGGEEGVRYPAKFPETMAVAAFGRDLRPADFSARGAEVDFAFPGVGIRTTWLKGGYRTVSGTSLACPACAGVIALLIAKHRRQEAETGVNDCRTVADIYGHLRKYAVNPDAAGVRDKSWGWGYVSVESLFGLAPRKSTPKPRWQRHRHWSVS